MKPSGIFQLKEPRDLLKKLHHDLVRLRQDTMDQYAAFDFFVTAEHLIDWLYPKSESERKNLRASSPLLALCSHIANGSKHFEATARHHGSFSDSEVHHGEFSNEFNTDFDVSGLLLTLEGEAKRSFGEKAYAHELAERVYEYWAKTLGAENETG